jgi:hypothetical protein
MLIHMMALLLIALLGFRAAKEANVPVISGGAVESSDKLELGDGGQNDVTTGTNPLPGGSEFSNSLISEPGLPTDVPINPLGQTADAVPEHVDLNPFGKRSTSADDLLKSIGGSAGSMGQGIGGRTGHAKEDLLKKGGGTPESEEAVQRALKWLSIHQMPDGGWDFDLEQVPACKGKCSDSGDASEARNAATAMALLPFLGAGQTHQEGQYKKTIQAGIYYLTTHAKSQGNNGLSYFEPEGTMYSHGLASIVLCEAYAMTKDRTLQPYAQGAIRFIEYAQDPSGGGWRYTERMAGDTSVVGWQIMALKSAQMAGLETRSSTMLLANKFLDTVQDDDGAAYGYTAPTANRPATTSIGLLCRMYLGWRKQHPALKRGVAALDKLGPSIKPNADMYYNYYATQVMHHWGGNEWDRWNYRIREWLISQQSRKGHESGSWYMSDSTSAPKARAGGRLYCTSLATMILEVYYRHMPLYGSHATKDEFSE